MSIHFGVFYLFVASFSLDCVPGLLLVEHRGDEDANKELNKAILEMLHIDKVSATPLAKPHPYMRRVYQLMDTRDFRNLDGTLVQSFRSVFGRGPLDAPPGWIWFNVTNVDASMLGAELVLFRKTLHPRPLGVTVALRGLVGSGSALRESAPLEEKLLTLDQRPPSGYDVFDASALLPAGPGPLDLVGFQLHYTDESGSLVLHQALTQSLYCLDKGSLSEPLLVLYQAHSLQGRSSEHLRP